MPLPSAIIVAAGVLIPLLASIALAAWFIKTWKPPRSAAFYLRPQNHYYCNVCGPPNPENLRPYKCHACGHPGWDS